MALCYYKMLPFISFPLGAAQIRRDEFLLSERILFGVIPAPVFTTTTRPPKIRLTGFGDLFR